MTCTDKVEPWPHLRGRGPFKAHMPDKSNGYVHVVDKDGGEVAACYLDGASSASCIAAALNSILGPFFPDEEKLNG